MSKSSRVPFFLFFAPALVLALAAVSMPVAQATDTVAVAPTKEGLTRVGADKCKMCHKVQYESWSAGAHAKNEPVVDCESCHGPGSEYKNMSVMKDPEKAKAAGLVMPDAKFCTASCHQTGWQDEMLQRAHAHK